MIKTYVEWVKDSLTQQQKDDMVAKAAAMQAEGKTDGFVTKIEDPSKPNDYIIERHWNDMPAADEWIAFINAFDPVQTKIVDD